MSNKLRMALSSILLITGMFFLFYGQISGFVYERWLNKNQNEILTGITRESIQESLKNLENDEDLFDYSAVESIDNNLIMPDIDISEINNAIGIISVPSVDLEEPILYGTTNQNLLLGATTMKPNQKMGEGNYALAGHNHHSRNVLFQPIRYIDIGGEIHITDMDKVYTYKVIHKEVVQPSRVDVIEDVEGKNLITLVSCHARDGSDRIIVTGELHEVTDYIEE